MQNLENYQTPWGKLWPWRPVSLLLCGILRGYQLTLSPFIGRQCRFSPTCSNYGLEAVVVHGVLGGGLLTLKRLLRCQPWGSCGTDKVPTKKY